MIDRRLYYVVSTARYGSFTAAASTVGVTQSAITKSVADLEQQLGYSIFERTARGVLLTEAGRSFVERATRLLDETEELMGRAIAGSDPYAGVLRIGVCPASLDTMLVEPVWTLSSRHPIIRFEIGGGSYDKVVQQLRAGAIDVAVGYDAAFLPHPDIKREPVATVQAAFFSRHGHPILDCPEVTKEELLKYDLIWPSSSSPYYSVSQNAYSASGLDVHDRIHVIENFAIVKKIVRNSDAISLADILNMETPGFQKIFARIPFPSVGPPQTLCCATRLKWTPRPAVRAFIKACRERLPSLDAISTQV